MPSRARSPRWPWLPLLLLALWAGSGAGCERGGTPQQSSPPQPTPQQSSPPSATSLAAPVGPPAVPAADAPVILMLGDSLTAGFGLAAEAAYPALIQARLRAGGYPHRVVNAGVSGDTSAGGRARLAWLLRQRTDLLLLALGANDGLRGQEPRAIHDNLAAIIETARARGIPVLLAGMDMPENYGPDYRGRFRAVFADLARQYDLPFIPFLLQGVAMEPALNQADGIHPNAEGARRVAEIVWAGLQPLLGRPAR